MRGPAAFVLLASLLWTGGSAVRAYEFQPIKPLDTKAVDPSLLSDIFGAWELRDKSGKRRCRVTLLKEFGIGGYQIDVAPNCKAAFPVMDDIAAWRLNEGWTIDFVDALRKVRLRFETPDNRYVVFGDDKDVAGIDDFIKLSDKPARKQK